MPSLYNCRHDGDQYRISKFDTDWNVEASYLCDLVACECPAGHRPSCRHRQMLPKFIQRNYVGTAFFFDFDRGGWVQGASIDLPLTEYEASMAMVEPSLTIATEITLPADATPDEVAEAFGNLLAPAGLGQASEPKESIEQKNDLHALRYSAGIENLQQLSPSPTPTIRRRV